MVTATLSKLQTESSASVQTLLKSSDFRRAYHRALDLADKSPQAQQAAARSIIEAFFRLVPVDPDLPLRSCSFYFTETPIAVKGTYKFLVPGTIKRKRISCELSLLKPKATSVERSVDLKEFDRAVAAVEAVRLTLAPERVNGIISFISDAKRFYAAIDAAAAERAIGTALDHLNRAATDGLRRITSEAEKGKRSNELAGTRRILTELRRTLQSEVAETKSEFV